MMNKPDFSRLPAHHLDPGAQEFFPTSINLSAPPQILFPYLPTLYKSIGYPHLQYPSSPTFYSADVEPPPVPASLPQASQMPSRTLLLSMLPSSVSESTVRRELEVFGDVRAVQMERRREGLVTVHFYDVRDAQAALAAIQEQHMQQQFRLGRHYDAVMTNSMASIAVAPPLPPKTARGLISGRVVWAQFITPVTSGIPDGNNQGTLVIFNLDPKISPASLKEIFEAHGPVKELRETPNKRTQMFVEFYDVRNAATAIAAMDGQEIHGRNVIIEYSRPGGFTRKPWKVPQNGISSSKLICPASINHHPSRNYSRCLPPSPSPLLSHLGQPSSPVKPPRNYLWKGNPNWSEGSKSSSSGFSPHGYEERTSVRRNRKYSPKNAANSGGTLKQLSRICCRPWKYGGGSGGRAAKNDHDPRFLINEDAIVESDRRDSRTTVMIKNIPNKYSQKLLLNMLDNHCIHCNEQMSGDDHPLSAYDFVYLPIDFNNKCNVGYGFVNMTSPEATLRLYKAFHHQNWEVFNSRKICQVTYARLQGLQVLKEHFKNSKFPGNAEEYMPVVFSPPRDGQTLTDPLPVIGHVAADSSPLRPSASAQSSAASSKENQSGPPSEEVNGNDEEGEGDGDFGSYDHGDV